MLDKTVECEVCEEQMQVKDVKIKEVKLDEGRSKSFWKCTNCHHEYLIKIDDKETKKLSHSIELDMLKIKKVHNSNVDAQRRNRLQPDKVKESITKVNTLGASIKAKRFTLDQKHKRLYQWYISKRIEGDE